MAHQQAQVAEAEALVRAAEADLKEAEELRQQIEEAVLDDDASEEDVLAHRRQLSAARREVVAAKLARRRAIRLLHATEAALLEAESANGDNSSAQTVLVGGHGADEKHSSDAEARVHASDGAAAAAAATLASDEDTPGGSGASSDDEDSDASDNVGWVTAPTRSPAAPAATPRLRNVPPKKRRLRGGSAGVSRLRKLRASAQDVASAASMPWVSR